MVVGAFPLAKLASLAVRQISKPIANYLKRAAKSSELFRRRICMPPAQIYHWSEVNVKMRLLGFGKVKEVKPLSEAAAVELGAEILGESFIFTVGVGVLVAEFWRQSRNEQHKEDTQNDSIKELQMKVEEMGFIVEQQDAKIRELNRRIAFVDHSKSYWTKVPASKQEEKTAADVSKETKEISNTTTQNKDRKKGWW
ncbi:optic atrophy 3 protein homolog [Saccoglossus kowalevskii]|uniref:Optic atrophy 3 protein homolog n=1 Tax=Saccoglossus kowalevskii TaxID=10224 RepID=A0ABM0GS12_SACKO|nr:PREDICTED: optic atrophy 3 protein homolog [Saccoglossus kowalevskii]